MRLLFLPPAPHTGAFFDSIRELLKDLETHAATYPGYGDVPAGTASIEAYAASLLPANGATLVGFHTGCLVAVEMALQSADVGALILVDIPYLDQETKEKYAAGLDPDNPSHDAFRAAFDYNAESAFSRLNHSVTCVATQSNLFDPTKRAAAKINKSILIERRDISKPAFETEAMALLLRDLAT